jgi:ankyrin repeat protein
MTSLNRIVPICLCVTTSLLLAACSEQEHPSSATIKPASQQAPTAATVQTPAPSSPKAEVTPQAQRKTESVAEVASGKAAATDAAAVSAQEIPTFTAKGDEANAQLPTTDAKAPPQKPTSDAPAVKTAPPPAPISTDFVVKAEPAELDMGEIPTGDTGKATLKLVNHGTKEMTVNSARASCGCTALKVVPGTVIPAGESLDVDVQMSAGQKEMEIHGKTVTFVIEGQPELVVPLKGKAVSFVQLEPATLDPATMPDGKFKLKSRDGKAFRVMSIQPSVLAEDLPKEPQTEYELHMSWTKFREIGINRMATVFLDHPKCQQLFIPVNFTPEEIAEDATRRQRELQNQKGIMAGDQGTKPERVAAQPTAPVDPEVQLTEMIKNRQNAEILAKIAGGLDVNHRDPSTGMTLLATAAKMGNIELMQALLATKKAELEGTDNLGRTPLMQAAMSKNHEAVRFLLDAGANPTTRDNLGTTALSWAAWMGDAASVKELIDIGSDVEVVQAVTGWTPLIMAAGFGDPASIDVLVGAHANIEAADFLQGATPLINAARTGRVESIKALLKHGANLENPDRNGNTALLSAAANSGGDAEKVKALIEAGANIRAKDNRGFNALQLARKRTDMRAEDVIKVLEPLLGAETAAAEAAKAQDKPQTKTEAKPADKPRAEHASTDDHGH